VKAHPGADEAHRLAAATLPGLGEKFAVEGGVDRPGRVLRRGNLEVLELDLHETLADAAHAVLVRDKSVTGNFFIDDEVLREAGVTDFEQYAVEPGKELLPDFFID